MWHPLPNPSTSCLELMRNNKSWIYKIIFYRYSVMQLDRNSFGGDVVSDNFNKTFRDVDNNLDQIYKSKYVRIIFVMILNPYNIIRKCILTQLTVALKPNLWVPCCYVLYFYKYAFPLITSKIQNLYNNDPEIFASHTFVLKHCLHARMPC